jgi:hypothetical protein
MSLVLGCSMGPSADPERKPDSPDAPTGSTEASADGLGESESKFVKPYVSCTDGICSTVDVSGTTRLGEAYPVALCPDVRRIGRPFRKVPVPAIDSEAMRPEDAGFAAELQWVTSQIRSDACTCCHDASNEGYAAMWDISVAGPWVDQLTDRGVAIMAGRLDSPAFGTKAGVDINGFSREKTGAPTTDSVRLRAFFDAELERRGVTAADLETMQQAEQ